MDETAEVLAYGRERGVNMEEVIFGNGAQIAAQQSDDPEGAEE